MAVNDKDAVELAAQIAASMGLKPKARGRRLQVVPPEGLPEPKPEGLSSLTRDTLYARVADLSGMYSLKWLVRQETMHVNYILECLPDAELEALLAKMDRAVEAIHDGVPFAELGLVRGANCTWVA